MVRASVFHSAVVRVGRFESRSPLGRATLLTTGASVTDVIGTIRLGLTVAINKWGYGRTLAVPLTRPTYAITYYYEFSLASVIPLMTRDLVPPADAVSPLTALFVFRFGHSADDRSSPYSGSIPAGHEPLVRWPFRRWL